MANFDNIIQEINTNLPDNTTQAITAAKLRTTLIDLTNQIDTVQDDFEIEINNTIISNIVDNLNSTATDKSLSANQGKILGDEVFQYIYQDNNISTNPYANDVAELYLVEQFPNTDNLQLKSYNNYVNFTDRTTNAFVCKVGFNQPQFNCENNVVYELLVNITNDSANFPIGKLIGYVVFKDITHFLNNSSALASGFMINVQRSYKLNLAPLVLKYLSVSESSVEIATELSNLVVDNLTTDNSTKALSAKQGKILGDEVFQYIYQNNNISTNPYANDVAELYIIATLIDTITNISLRSYQNALFFRALSPNNLFTCRLEANGYSENGVVYKLKITATNDSTNYPIGKLIGYIVFKDITHFKANAFGSDTFYINLDRAQNITFNQKCFKESENYIIESTVEDAIETIDFPTYLNGVEVNLPDEIVVSKGDRLQVFWRNVCTAFNPYAFDVFGQCKLGNNYFGYSYPRYFQFDATDDMVNNSTYPLTVYVRNNNAEVIASKSTTIRVVDKISTPSQNKNVLIIGASATANGNIIYELNRRLNTATGYEYKWKQSGGSLPNVHLGDIYKDSLNNEFTVTEIGTDFIGVVKTLSVSTASSQRTVTLVSGDTDSPQSFVLGVATSSYPKVYEKPYGLNTQRFNFIGTTQPSGYSDLYQEARGGWSWKDYSTVGRYAYRFYVTEQTGIMEGAKYQGNNTLVFTVTNDIQIDPSGNGDFSCTYTGTGNQTQTDGVLYKIEGNGPEEIYYDSWSPDSANPFWNNSTQQLDFLNYITNVLPTVYPTTVSSIDLVIFHLGVNDIFSSRPISDCIGYMQTFLNRLKAQYPDVKVIISTLPMPSPYGGMTSNYGTNIGNSYWTKSKQFCDYATAFNELVNSSPYNGYVQLSTPLHTFDSENLYPTINLPVDNRNSITEIVQNNGVHPTSNGGYTVADDIYHSIMKVMQ